VPRLLQRGRVWRHLHRSHRERHRFESLAAPPPVAGGYSRLPVVVGLELREGQTVGRGWGFLCGRSGTWLGRKEGGKQFRQAWAQLHTIN
jgi:hypothetical protein